VAPRRRKERVIDDPRAIRALAHPARLAVLDALNDGTELTATACAEIAGLSPSAMSYHLRALEKWGFVERVDSTADGRERPWRAVSDSFRIDALPDAAMAAATTALATTSLERLTADLQKWFAHEATQPTRWQRVAAMSNQHAWLTVDEAEELQRIYQDFVDARRGRTQAAHPDGARRVRLTRVMVPLQFD
jgi:DNA-binding transcriptional ArsR family regulator